MSNNKTYIVIELDETENAGDVMNVLMAHTKAQFTVTKDLQKYAAERTDLQTKNTDRKRTAEASAAVVEEFDTAPPSRQSHLGYDPFIQNKFREYSDEAPPKKQRPNTTRSDVEPIVNISDDDEQKPLRCQLPVYHQVDEDVNIFLDSPEDFQPMSGYTGETTMNDGNYMSTEPETSNLPKKKPIEAFQCQKCGALIKTRGMDFFKRSAHAIIHTEVLRYKCPVEECKFKNRHRADCVRHLKVVHKMDAHNVKIEDCMTEPEKVILRKMVYKCFPEVRQRRNARNDNFEIDMDEENIQNVVRSSVSGLGARPV